MNECCFVWGVPLSGQRYWMTRAAEETEDAHVTLLPIENHFPQPALMDILNTVERHLVEPPLGHTGKRHIYCELPWEVTQDAEPLEEWLSKRPEFAAGPPALWNLSFVAVCPTDAGRLPAAERRGLEEFARASQSAVIIARREGDTSEVEWFDTEILDFGKRVEVFEEDLWPPNAEGEKEFTSKEHRLEDLQTLTLPVSGDRTSYHDLFQDLAHGYYGSMWGAEAYWKNNRGEFEALTLSQGKLFSWTSDHPSLVQSAPLNGAMLSLAGSSLRQQELMTALRSQSFC